MYTNKTIEKIIEKLFLLAALMSVISMGAIIFFVFFKGMSPFIGKDSYSVIKFLTGTKWAPGDNIYGVLHMIVASLGATIGALLFSVIFGVFTSVFIVEFAPKPVLKACSLAIEMLAGIPSVLFGAFGLGVIVPLIAKFSPNAHGQSMLAVIIVLSVMILPTIIVVSNQAIKSVPKSYREASFALGATKIQTVFKVVLLAAKRGIFSAIVLGIGRALGETMAVMLIAGNKATGILKSIFDMVRPLTTNIAMEMGYASGTHSDMLFATGVVLFIFIMFVNITLIKLMKDSRG